VQGHVSSSTQNQAKSALLLLYREVPETELPWLDGVVSANHTRRLPVVLTQEEVDRLLERMRGTSALVARLLYGSGRRILEGLTLRVKDLDFERREIPVRELYAENLAAGCGEVYLPYALARNYLNASRQWMWQYVFPSARLSKDPRSSAARRHRADEKPIQRAVQAALRACGDSPVTLADLLLITLRER